MSSPIDLSGAVIFEEPFPHFHVSCAMEGSFADELLDWFEREAPWKLTTASFYEQYEFSLLDVALPEGLASLCDLETLSYLRRKVGALLGAQLNVPVDVTAHQLVPGQRIRTHNDYVPGRETHRLLVQLNREWAEDHGGVLVLFHSAEPEAVRRLIRPIKGSGFGFSISSRSHHAVSAVHKGQRFTLVYSFYELATRLEERAVPGRFVEAPLKGVPRGAEGL